MGKEAGTCVHFNGIQNEACKAGIAYDSFPKPGLPCMKDFCKGQVCDNLRFPTPEEVAAAEAARETSYKRFELAYAAVREDAKKRGLRKGNGGAGNATCPNCQGTLSYSVASYNGHVHCRCSTEGCVWWMQ